MPCEDDHWIDGDPCINCWSTHTDGTDDPSSPTEVRCLEFGEIFDVAGPEYQLFAEGAG